MTNPKARLIVSACLFAGWIGFLAWLVVGTRNPVILSRTQLLAADLVVIADVEACQGWPCPEVTVAKVVWSSLEGVDLAGKSLAIEGIVDCGKPNGWTGADKYVLFLSKRTVGKADLFVVTALPITPGYFSALVTVELLSPGPQPDKLAGVINANLAGLSAAQIQNLLKSSPTVLKRNVPREEASRFKKSAEAMDAVVRLQEGETRIYAATPSALQQLDELIGGP